MDVKPNLYASLDIIPETTQTGQNHSQTVLKMDSYIKLVQNGPKL